MTEQYSMAKPIINLQYIDDYENVYFILPDISCMNLSYSLCTPSPAAGGGAPLGSGG